jgi:serine/threonine-protein kinase HipA
MWVVGVAPNGLDLSNSVENEYLCLTLLAAWGLPSAAVEMASFEDRRVLVVERFDRFHDRDHRLLRRPQEDFCQALSTPWVGKYEADGGPGVLKGLDLLAASDTPANDRLAFLKAQVVFWLLGATDGHAKNFSLFLQPGGGFRMTPLYDVLSAEPSRAARQIEPKQMKLAMAVGERRHYRVGDVAPRHFVQSGAAGGLDPEAVRNMLAHLAQAGPPALDRVLASLPADFPAAVSSPIAQAAHARLAQIGRYLDGDAATTA